MIASGPVSCVDIRSATLLELETTMRASLERETLATIGRPSTRRHHTAGRLLLTLLAGGCGILSSADDVMIINVTPNPIVLEVGESRLLSAQVSSATGNTVQVRFMTANASVATASVVDLTSARVTGVAPGSTTISVWSPDEPLRITDVPVEVVSQRFEIDIDPGALDIEPGQTGQLTCIVRNGQTGAVIPNEPVTYTSRLPNIATVDANGRVVAVAEGVTDITCEARNAEPVMAQVRVFIPRIVEIDPTGTVMTIGEIRTFTCTTRHAVTGQPVNDTYTWVTSNAAIAAVDPNGRVLALSEGTATITCRPPNGTSAAATVSVRPSAFTVEVSPPSLTLAPGQTATLTCTVRDAATGQVVTNQSYTWYVSNTAVASVDANGNVAAIAEGQTVVVCELDSGGAGSAQLTVTAPPTTQPLCDPQRTDTNVLKIISSILRGDLTSFCTNATAALATGPVVHKGQQQARALDHTSLRIAGGVPSWSLNATALNALHAVYPCGPHASGFTACAQGMTGPLPAGDYVMVYTVLHAPLPVAADGFIYQYGFAFDGDGNPANNYTDPNTPAEFFLNTDFWVLVDGEPGRAWQITALNARNNTLTQAQTNARAIIDGATMFLIVPRSSFAINAPPLRFSTFGIDAMGNWKGDVQRPLGQPLYTLPIGAVSSPDR
jgi:uncharacterized protein YjdB